MRALRLDTFAALLGAAWLSSFAVAAIGCTGAPAEGEGEGSAGEGEGAAGEGEGAVGEGEGAVGEGEGEGVGEGEGEGFGADTVGDETNPLDVTVTEATPFSTTTTIETGDDHDCYRFTTTDTLFVIAETSGSCVSGSPDTIVDLDQADGTRITSNDEDPRGDFTSHCSFVETSIDPGTYLVCVRTFAGDVGSATLTITLEQPQTLGAGDACTPGDIARACDATIGLACVDDGTGATTCTNPSAASCAAAVEYAGGAQSVTPTGTTEGTQGSCGGFQHDPESVVHYVTSSPLAQVTFTSTGADTLFVRTTCDVPDTEVNCADFANTLTVVADDVAAGTDLFAFVEAASGTPATIEIVERPVRAAGDTCDATGATDVCDPALGLACIADAGNGSTTCQDPNVVACAAQETMTGNDFTGTIGAENLVLGSCTSTPRDEAFVAYTADASIALQKLTVTLTVDGAGPNPALSVRSACESPASELACTTSTIATASVDLKDVAGGTTLFFLAEDVNAGATFHIHVDVTPIVILNEGDACDPTSDTSICDQGQALRCRGTAGAETCQAADAGDTCANAFPLSGASGVETGDTTGFFDDTNLGSGNACTGFSTPGPETFYAITLSAGQTLTATLSSDAFDGSLYVLDACPFSDAGQCVAGSDKGFATGIDETVTFTNTTGADLPVFIGVDSFFTTPGPYTLTWSVQ